MKRAARIKGKHGRYIDVGDPPDEFVAEGKIHLEAMDDGASHITIVTPDGYNMLVHFTFHSPYT